MKLSNFLIGLCFLIFVGGFLMSTSSDRASQQTLSSARVAMDVYSGRPNPEWSLSTDQVAELKKRLAALSTIAPADAKISDDLGYRAMHVELRDANGGNEIAVSRGLVVQKIGTNVKRHVDEQRKLELWLVNTGEGKLSADLLQKTTAQITSKP
jgi:hypothetical protein